MSLPKPYVVTKDQLARAFAEHLIAVDFNSVDWNKERNTFVVDYDVIVPEPITIYDAVPKEEYDKLETKHKQMEIEYNKLLELDYNKLLDAHAKTLTELQTLKNKPWYQKLFS